MEKLKAFFENVVISAKLLGIVLTGAYLSCLGIIPHATGEATLATLAWNGWAIPKVIGGFVVAARWRVILRLSWAYVIEPVWYWILDTVVLLAGGQNMPSDCIDDVPRVELLDHLFRNKSLLREEAEVAFRIPRYRVTDLKKNLERVGVLVRGVNNSHVLNPEYSRQDVAAILDSAHTASKLRPLFRKTEAGTFTSEPSAAEIQERVTSLLRPAPGFENKILASS